MTRTTPKVEHDTLTVGPPGAERAVRLGTSAWFKWLDTATAFRFVSPQGTFTARREPASSGRGGGYWRAYRRYAGRLKRAYLGKAAELTLERLQAVAASLGNAAAPAPAPNQLAEGAPATAVESLDVQALPTGTVTFLFTDIVGSTQLWEQHHEAMHTALARHDRVLRQAIAIHGGVVFKTVGDSIYAVFARAPDALAAALDAQRALQQERWDSTGPLRVRMALHTGAAELREGDYFGPPLNRAARILALGHGGQILLSRATQDLVVDELPAQTSLRALGDYHLKDLARPELIFQCVSANLPADFPPLRMDDPRPGVGVPAPQLLATKLYLPRARPDLVARPQLCARLDTGLHGVLTLVCAPAGFGKTTLLAEWLRRTGRPAAWLGLDAGDSDPVVFLRYLVAALQALAPEVGATLLGLLQSPQLPPLETLLTVLINDLAALPHDGILVLDDYHVLEAPPIHQAVSFLIDHLPPALHLIIATREDPPLGLARLRARRQVAELRADQLRFTADEAAAFLTELMGLALTAADIAALEACTEGWIAGLQLAALAMRDRDDHASFIAAFTGSNRFIVDYLADEVLTRQPTHIQAFLLQTSILDRMCGSLCDAVLGLAEDERPKTKDENESPFVLRPSSFVGAAYSQLVLEQLERANLFVTPLDAERCWYRYHHLFGEVLRERLRRGVAAAEMATLHHRASAWYEQHGLLPEAVQHALAAGDGALAARLIEALARPMQLRGEMVTVMGWLAALPPDVLRAHPHLGVIYAWGLATTGQVPAAERWLQDVEHGLAAHPDCGNLLGEVTVIRVTIALVQGDFSRTLELARQALAYLSDDQLALRALTNMSLGSAYTGLGDLEAAGQNFAQASALYQAGGQIELALTPLRQLCRVQLVQGRLNELDQTTQHALRLAAQWKQRSSLVGYTYLSLGELWYQRNDLAAAGRSFVDGLALVDLGGARDIMNVINLADGHLGLARVKHAQGDLEGALELMGRIELIVGQLARGMQLRGDAEGAPPSALQAKPAIARPAPILSYFDQIAAFRVWLWLSQGDIGAASQWLQTRGLSVAGDIKVFHEVGLIALARVLLAQGELDRALALLARLLGAAEAGGWKGRVIEMLALQALALHLPGRESEALSALERALRLAEPEGYIRIFVDEGAPMAALLQKAHASSSVPSYVDKLLAAFPRTEGRGLRAESAESIHSALSPQPSALVEPLTTRELEVLRLLADGASNGEIAQRLIVSLGTVKKHIANIFGKLEAQSRTQAVARARALDLL